MDAETKITIEVVYATARNQAVARLHLPAGTTVREAIDRSGLRLTHPELPVELPVGIHGRVVEMETVLHAGARVEIYRPLVADPKQARRRRARREADPNLSRD